MQGQEHPKIPVGTTADTGLDEENEEGVDPVQEEEEEVFVPSSFQEDLQDRFPRTYFVTVQMILPLFLLIAMAFFFGWLLTLAEIQEEIDANDAAILQTFYNYLQAIDIQKHIRGTVTNTTNQCLERAQLQVWNQTATLLEDIFENFTESNAFTRVRNCALDEIEEHFPRYSTTDGVLQFLVAATPALTFNWMVCTEYYDGMNNVTAGEDEEFQQALVDSFGKNEESSYDQQSLVFMTSWSNDMVHRADVAGYKYDMFRNDPSSYTQFANSSTGGYGCHPHVAGGAFFWFTVMTTIGYGNAAPITPVGRMLVFTGGFFSIIGFLALTNTSATVIKLLFEDIFWRYNCPFLIQGPLCILFWVFMLILWMCVLAFSFQVNVNSRLGGKDEASFPLGDAFWFSYITTTTVGLGDIHINHEEFQSWDMFTFPLVILVGLNLVGILTEKMFDLYDQYFPDGGGFANILERKRRQAAKAQRSPEAEKIRTRPSSI